MLSTLTAPALALALLAGHSHAFSLTVAPAKSAAHVGQTSSVRVYDTGTDPLQLTASVHEVSRIHGKCHIQPQPVTYVALSRSSFRLRHGGEVTVRVRVLKHGAKPGKHTLATVISAPMGQRGNVRIAGAAASLMLLDVPGTVHGEQPKPCVALSGSSPHHSGALWTWVGIGFAVLAALLVIWLIWRRRRVPEMLP